MKGVVVPAVDFQLIPCPARFLCYGPDTPEGKRRCQVFAEDHYWCDQFDPAKVLLVPPDQINCDPSHSLQCIYAGRREECVLKDGYGLCAGHLQDERTPDHLMQKLHDALSWSLRERRLI